MVSLLITVTFVFYMYNQKMWLHLVLIQERIEVSLCKPFGGSQELHKVTLQEQHSLLTGL